MNKYAPDTYDKEKMSKFHNNDFLNYQVKYRNSLEKYLMKKIDFKMFDNMISDLHLPEVDRESSFYYKYSTLNSKYLFLRNNIHVERLDEEDLIELRDSELVSDEFILSTYKNVLYEDNDYSMFGVPLLENKVKSKSIVFAIAYNRDDCKNLDSLINIDTRIDFIKDQIRDEIEMILDSSVSIVVYNYN